MDLPKVFANPIKHRINNVQDVFKEGSNREKMDVKEYVDNLYKKGRIVYMIDFMMRINGVEVYDRIVSKTDDYIITKNNGKVYFRDIEYIEEKKKAL